MVVKTNAIVYPRTVMIETLHTLVTHIAMSGARSSYHLAVWT